MHDSQEGPAQEFVVVANRLPVDVSVDEDGTISWIRAPGGLVTALAPMMRSGGGAWVGWSGSADLELDPFTDDGIAMTPVPLSAAEIEEFYEGFSNATLWPLYHDVIVDPEYHREWWSVYRTVNERFAAAAAAVAAPGATVWVQDYQLQLVPALLRSARPDLHIGFFLHIPFPPMELFGQLPWRHQVLEGLLGSDLIGFQRSGDAANFLRSVRRFTAHPVRGQNVSITTPFANPGRTIRAGAFPISLDSKAFNQLANRPETIERARQIRRDLGDPQVLLLGVDRLDYTKGIRHRIKAFGEMLAEGAIGNGEAVLVQVASPSREQVAEYVQLRSEVEEMVGRINGDHAEIGRPVIHYLHHSYPAEEMAAMFRAADVVLVTALRDGMNLVAKEYVAARSDLDGVLVLSEFAGAADELTSALQVNPHDIEGMKTTILSAMRMPREQRRRRMRALRRRVLTNDVAHWARSFLTALAHQGGLNQAPLPGSRTDVEARDE
ncbi:trehalose-6-phosphate synthase [Pseudactinotalea sp. HY160]|uniref:alpha,alpha-trehalose-phosphate synthase (UDP-forming) n=1 Tax=Pseudactinotalea sp. HY160 TaxID=2654490 RepID=UPI00128BE7B3|nr:trehalose-6-phosphate synthase [Pseudactinotalea sp. HY160]MPV48453.1 trehalose-6-phosphate synthase [Pseudactinotalea sp. HY160]